MFALVFQNTFLALKAKIEDFYVPKAITPKSKQSLQAIPSTLDDHSCQIPYDMQEKCHATGRQDHSYPPWIPYWLSLPLLLLSLHLLLAFDIHVHVSDEVPTTIPSKVPSLENGPRTGALYPFWIKFKQVHPSTAHNGKLILRFCNKGCSSHYLEHP